MRARLNPNYDNHEEVVVFSNSAIGLAGVIAIHSTALGPAARDDKFLPDRRVTASRATPRSARLFCGPFLKLITCSRGR